MDGLRPTLNPSLDSNNVSCVLTLAQGRKNMFVQAQRKRRFRRASALSSVGRNKNVGRAGVVAKANVFSCHQRNAINNMNDLF